MVTDILTVMWKEAKELLETSGSKGGLLRLAIWIVILGIFLPVQMQSEWFRSPAVLFYWIWFPLFVVSSVVAGAFAGERDQHSLETLLSSRLPDPAILLGKLAAGSLYGWGLTLSSVLLGWITVNVTTRPAVWQGYQPELLAGGLGLSLLAAVASGGLGILVALHAATARQAQQSLSLATILLFFIPYFVIQALPVEIQEGLQLGVASITMMQGLLGGGGILFLVAAILVGISFLQFRRDRLILD